MQLLINGGVQVELRGREMYYRLMQTSRNARVGAALAYKGAIWEMNAERNGYFYNGHIADFKLFRKVFNPKNVLKLLVGEDTEMLKHLVVDITSFSFKYAD